MSIKIDDSSKPVVLYNSSLPQVSLKRCLNKITDRVFRRSLELAKFESGHLQPSRHLYQILPSLTGPYFVGCTNLTLEIPEVHVHSVKYDKIGMEIYAPTLNKIGKRIPLPDYLVKEEQTHAFDDLQPVKKKFPILIFSHGAGFFPTEYRPLLEELASHGYVVINLHHPLIAADAPQASDSISYDDKVVIQANDIRLVIDAIQTGQLNKALKPFSLTEEIILAGHSLGGAAAVLVSRKDARIRGCINLDGSLRGDVSIRTKGLKTPVLTLISESPSISTEQEKEQQQMLHQWQVFHENSPRSQKQIIKGISHEDFSIVPYLGWLKGESSLERGLRGHKITSQEILKFMR